MATALLGICLVIANTSEIMAGSAPVLKAIPRQYVTEGATLQLAVSATDSDGDRIALAATSRPHGAAFTDNGNGTGLFKWTPDYDGPNSCEGSPFSVTFRAGDGQSSSLLSVEIVVVNNNRQPVITCPDTVAVESGNQLTFQISGYDPDLDALNWQVLSKPAGLEFDPGKSAAFEWNTGYADSGFYDVKISLIDQYGASDTADIVLNVKSTVVYALTADTVSAYPGENLPFYINFENLEAISGFNVLVNYDATVLMITSVSAIGTRAESFEYFNYRLEYRGLHGDILITGIADVVGGVEIPDLTPGTGPVARLTAYVTSDLNYAGYLIPIRFVFRDLIEKTDNTLTDPLGGRIEQEQINFTDGGIEIKSTSPDALGDINLNGVTYEIGDVIYFTNFFIDPLRFSLSPLQWLNSDVNQDGHAATIADLVFMMNHLLNTFRQSTKPIAGGKTIGISAGSIDGRLQFSYDSESELGGVALTLQSSQLLDPTLRLTSAMEESGMIVKYSVDGNLLRLLIYSDDGHLMPAGINELFVIENKSDFKINDIQISSPDGALLNSAMKEELGGILPKGYRLYQNYPNPFNPVTDIRFDLPEQSPVEISVFNLLGQNIRSLVDATLPAGSHRIEWDGRDNDGRAVSSGIYFYNLKTQTFSAKKKMLLLK